MTFIGLALVTLIGVGIRLVMMSTIQQRRERANRQINERLRVLIAAYKTLGGSFTGDLTVDPTHHRDLLRREEEAALAAPAPGPLDLQREAAIGGSDRARRIRDAVEAALSDVILLGTEAHVRLADQAARDLVAGRPIHTQALVVALRDFIRAALDLDPIPAGLAIPMQGPARPAPGGNNRKDKDDGQRGDKGGGQGMGMGGGGGGGGGFSLTDDDAHAGHHS